MKVTLIASIGKNGELGLDNKLLWKSPSDLSNFKRITEGHPIIMGRKTFESLPGILPNRYHIVLASKPVEIKPNPFNSPVMILNESIKDVIKTLKDTTIKQVFIIGGASIYKQALELDLVDELLITHMDWEGKADTFLNIDYSKWKYVDSTEFIHEFPNDNGPKWVQKRYIKKN